MNDALPQSSASGSSPPAAAVREIEPRPLVRLRCGPCDVAWSGVPDSECWVCGEPGVGLRSVVRYRERELFDLDFDY